LNKLCAFVGLFGSLNSNARIE